MTISGRKNVSTMRIYDGDNIYHVDPNSSGISAHWSG